MKALGQFLHFDIFGFLQGKTLVVTNKGPWKKYGDNGKPTDEVLGTKLDCAITRDETKYAPNKNGGTVSNLYERLTVKLPHDVAVSIGDAVELVEPTATVYGDFRDKLSVTATDIKVVTATPAAPKGKD